MLERMKNVLKNRKQDDKGFSLVELAVVIVIIGILVAIAVPVFANLQSSASTAKNEANAANGAQMVAAFLANEPSGEADTADVQLELNKLKNDGASAGASLSAPSSGSVTLSNFCVTVASSTSGPGCAS